MIDFIIKLPNGNLFHINNNKLKNIDWLEIINVDGKPNHVLVRAEDLGLSSLGTAEYLQLITIEGLYKVPPVAELLFKIAYEPNDSSLTTVYVDAIPWKGKHPITNECANLEECSELKKLFTAVYKKYNITPPN